MTPTPHRSHSKEGVCVVWPSLHSLRQLSGEKWPANDEWCSKKRPFSSTILPLLLHYSLVISRKWIICLKNGCRIIKDSRNASSGSCGKPANFTALLLWPSCHSCNQHTVTLTLSPISTLYSSKRWESNRERKFVVVVLKQRKLVMNVWFLKEKNMPIAKSSLKHTRNVCDPKALMSSKSSTRWMWIRH